MCVQWGSRFTSMEAIGSQSRGCPKTMGGLGVSVTRCITYKRKEGEERKNKTKTPIEAIRNEKGGSAAACPPTSTVHTDSPNIQLRTPHHRHAHVNRECKHQNGDIPRSSGKSEGRRWLRTPTTPTGLLSNLGTSAPLPARASLRPESLR